MKQKKNFEQKEIWANKKSIEEKNINALTKNTKKKKEKEKQNPVTKRPLRNSTVQLEMQNLKTKCYFKICKTLADAQLRA